MNSQRRFNRTPLLAAMLLVVNPAVIPQAVAAPGDTAGGEFLLSTYTISHQWDPHVAMDADGDFVAVWIDYLLEGYYGIYAQRFQADGALAGPAFKVNTWTTSVQSNPRVAMDADGDFVVCWDGINQDGSGYGIFAQRFQADGSPADTEFQVNSYTTSTQSKCSVAMDADGDFVVAWQSNGQDGSSNGVYAQRYRNDGLALDGEFRVNSYTTSAQLNASVAMDADGDFVISWDSFAQDGSFYGVYAQRFQADGNAVDPEFRVNTYTTQAQRLSSVAMDAVGNFVISWQSVAQDGSGQGIFAQRYLADGSAVDLEFRVNTYTTQGQGRPSVAMDADGDFVISWQSNVQDGSGYGIYAQRYHADGTTDGNEFPVNAYTNLGQRWPSVAMDADGDFVIAWQDENGHDGDVYGVYAQRYEGAGETVDMNIVVSDDIDPIEPGNSFTYTLMASNYGTGMALDVNLFEPLPGEVSYVSDDAASAGWNCTNTSGTLACNKPFMTSSEMNSINITVTADTLGTASNTVTLNAAQSDANAADNSDTETTSISDLTAPVMTLLGDDPMTVVQYTVFSDPGVSVTDNIESGLMATATGSVDASTTGSYLISYDVSDSAGNAATTVTRTVNVTDETAPVITLLGDAIMTMTQSQTFNDPGTIVSDNFDTNLVARVIGSVDPATVGTYILSYNASDSAGNIATTVTRIVYVNRPKREHKGLYGIGGLGWFSVLLSIPLWLSRRFKR